jgi:hypothetical protein
VSISDDLVIVARRGVGRERWDAVADASGDAWLWHLDALIGALWTWRGATDLSFGLAAPDGELLGLMPLTAFEERRARGLVRSAHVLSLGGPAVSTGMSDKHRSALRQALVDRAFELTRAAGGGTLEVTLPPLAPALRGESCPRINPLLELGFENALTQTWMIDLRSGRDAVLAGIRDRARGELKRAERAGLEVREANRSTDVDIYYDLHLQTYERTGATAHPRKYFERIWSDLVPAGRAVVFFAELEGEVVAARNFATYKRSGLYWTGASNQRGLGLGAGALLQWHALEWMLERNYEWAETGEAFPGTVDPKLQGLSLHKASFGGSLYPLFRGRRDLPTRTLSIVDALSNLRAALRP